MKNFVQQGDVMGVTAPADVVSGEPVQVGKLFGIATGAALSGDTVQIKRTGVFSGVPKATGSAWTVGALLYWSSGNSNFTTSASGNTLVGVAAAAAGSGDTTGTVLLDGAAR